MYGEGLFLQFITKMKIGNSFNKSLGLIKKNKFLFVAILLLQLVFFSVFFSVQFNYWLKIMDKSLEVIDYLSAQNLEESAITDGLLMGQGVLGEDPVLVYQNAKSILNDFIKLSFISIISFIVFEGLLWALTDNLVNKKKFKNFLIYLRKFSLLTMGYVLLFYVLLFSILKTLSVDEAAVPTFLTYVGLVIMFLFVLFVFASYALIGKYKILEAVKVTFFRIKKNLVTVLLSFLIIIIAIGLFSYLIVLMMELQLILLFLVLVCFILCFVLGRIFLYVVMNETKG